MKMSNKKGSNFLVLNKLQASSSEEEADMTISHEPLVSVQEEEQETKSRLSRQHDEEEGKSTDDEETASDEDHLLFCKKMYYVPSGIIQQYLNAGYFWTVSTH